MNRAMPKQVEISSRNYSSIADDDVEECKQSNADFTMDQPAKELTTEVATMADIMSHGSDGAGDPPHLPPHRLYTSSLSLKRRGISRGIKLEKVWQVNGNRPLAIAFNNVK